MTQSRKDLIAQYDIQEPELKTLLDDLCSKPEDANNLTIIKKALRGIYSDFGSPLDCPVLTLAEHLKMADYPDLVKKAYNGDYDHNYGSKLKDIEKTSSIAMARLRMFLEAGKDTAEKTTEIAPQSPKL